MRKTIIDYYLGGLGPTIYIGIKTMDWLVKLRDTLIKLRDGIIDVIAFHQFEDVDVSNVNTFILFRSTKRMKPSISVHYSKKNGAEITWIQDDNALEYMLILIGGIVERDSPEHQLLDEDGVVIEFSYKENL